MVAADVGIDKAAEAAAIERKGQATRNNPDLTPLADYDPKDYEAEPRAAWALTVRMARMARIPVEIEIEYEPLSEHAGRRARLSYDPKIDQEKFEWLDS